MEYTINADGAEITVAVSGQIDTFSSPILEEGVMGAIDDAEKLIFDFANTEYITSAGLRVLLGAQKAMMKKQGSMVIINVNNEVMEVFEVTKFSDFLTIE